MERLKQLVSILQFPIFFSSNLERPGDSILSVEPDQNFGVLFTIPQDCSALSKIIGLLRVFLEIKFFQLHYAHLFKVVDRYNVYPSIEHPHLTYSQNKLAVAYAEKNILPVFSGVSSTIRSFISYLTDINTSVAGVVLVIEKFKS